MHLIVVELPSFLRCLMSNEKLTDTSFKQFHKKLVMNNSHCVFMQALALCRYLEEFSVKLVTGRRVIELGAGTGLVGLVAHSLGTCDMKLIFFSCKCRGLFCT